jgi:hypothetical protein
MGAYHNVVNPAKRQFLDMGTKHSVLLYGAYAEFVALLLWDEHRSEEWPFALIGSWAGDTIYLTSDEEFATIVRSETEYVLPYCIDTRTPAKPERNLWSMALEEFEEISANMIALVYEFRPAVYEEFVGRATARRSYGDFEPQSRKRSDQRVRETIEKLGARRAVEGPVGRVSPRYPLGERFLLVQPSTRQYLNATRLGEGGTLRHLLGKRQARVFSLWLLYGEWIHTAARLGPIFAAGQFSNAVSPGTTPPPGTPARNLYETALAEYTEVSFHFLFQYGNNYDLREIVAQARDNPAQFLALGNAVFEEELPFLEAELTEQYGTEWLDWYLAIQSGDATAPPKRPPEPAQPPAAVPRIEAAPPAPAPVVPGRGTEAGLPLIWHGEVVGYWKDPETYGYGSMKGTWAPAGTPATDAFLAALQSDSPVVISFDGAGIAWWQDQQPGRGQEDFDANQFAFPGILQVASLRDGVLRIFEADEWAQRGLAQVLRDARTLLARPENDFAWSSWKDADAALRELDALIAHVEAGTLPRKADLTILFAPTGRMQEVSLSSGWSGEFLALAARFDNVVKMVYPS